MKKILIICFYELKDYLLNIEENFNNLLYTVYSYPLFRYAYDKHDKITNYKEHLSDHISNIKPDIILWWFIDVPNNIFTYIKERNIDTYFILYNNDDVTNMSADLLKKASIFDLIIVPCKENIIKYKVHSKVSNIIYSPPCHDPLFFFPITPQNIYSVNMENTELFTCDISIVCHDLYIDTSYYNCQYINRKILIDDIITYCMTNKKIFKIFGSPNIKEYYPNYYHGEINYMDLNKLYNLSKINIVTHSFSNKSMYVNEHVSEILASGGLLLMDKNKDIEKILGTDICIFLDKIKYVSQINYILNNYDEYNTVKQKAHIFSHNFTWKKWTDKVHVEISRHFFNDTIYQDLYELDKETGTWNYWMENGLNNNHICYDFQVPNCFKYQDYANELKISHRSTKYIYLHWRINSKNNIYMNSKTTNVKFNCEDYFITTQDYFNFCGMANKLVHSSTIDNGLRELNHFSSENPFTDINYLLDIYLSSL